MLHNLSGPVTHLKMMEWQLFPFEIIFMRLYHQKCEKCSWMNETVKISPEILVMQEQRWIIVGRSVYYCFGWDCCLIKPLLEGNAKNSRPQHEQSSWHDCIQWKAELKRTMMELIKRLDTMSRTQKFITWQPSWQNNNPDSWCCHSPGWLLLAAGWQRGSDHALESFTS